MYKPETIAIKGERAKLMDIKAHASLQEYGLYFDEEAAKLMDTDVKRAVKYNEIVFTNVVKRVIAFAAKPSSVRARKEQTLRKLMRRYVKLHPKDQFYFQEYPHREQFEFLNAILDKNVKVRGYTEYILYALVNHFQSYNRN